MNEPPPRLALFAAVFAVQLAGLVAIQLAIHGYPDADSHYHAALARMIGREPHAPAFRWTAISVWSVRYADKEWLFHVMLAGPAQLGERLGDSVLAIKLAAAVFAAAALQALYWLLRRREVPWPELWLALAWGLGAAMLLRLITIRPHTVSLLLVLLALECALSRRLRALVAIGAVYALAYTAWHALLIALAVVAAAEALGGARGAARPLLAGVIGVALGLAVHPHAPHHLEIWWIQNVRLWQAVKLDGPGWDPRSTELSAAGPGQLLVQYGWAALILGLAAFRLVRRRWRPPPDALAVWALAAAFGVLNAAANRFAEYWTTLGIAACAVAVRELQRAGDPAPAALLGRRPRLALLVALALALGSARQAIAAVYRTYSVDLSGPAGWLADHTPAGDRVFLPSLVQFPQYFDLNRHNHYLVGLDRVFALVHDPEACHAYVEAAAGAAPDPVAAIRNRLGCRWVVLDGRAADRLATQLGADPRAHLRASFALPLRSRPLADRLPWLFADVPAVPPGYRHTVRVFELRTD